MGSKNKDASFIIGVPNAANNGLKSRIFFSIWAGFVLLVFLLLYIYIYISLLF